MRNRKLFSEIIYTAASLAKGMGITFAHIFRKKVTLQYPEQRWTLPEGYRGMPALPIDRNTGNDACIACGSCARICPEQVITIKHEVGEDKKRKAVEFDIDMSRCMFCGLCSEACPTKGLVMSHTFELSSPSREKMVYRIEDLHKIGGYLPEKPQEESAEDKPKAEEKSTTGGEK